MRYTSPRGQSRFCGRGERVGLEVVGAREGVRMGAWDGLRDGAREGVRLGESDGALLGNEVVGDLEGADVAVGIQTQTLRNVSAQVFGLENPSEPPTMTPSGLPNMTCCDPEDVQELQL